jgi:hypothetical protein
VHPQRIVDAICLRGLNPVTNIAALDPRRIHSLQIDFVMHVRFNIHTVAIGKFLHQTQRHIDQKCSRTSVARCVQHRFESFRNLHANEGPNDLDALPLLRRPRPNNAL